MHGIDAPGLDATFRLYDGYLGKMEKTLATRPWLAGESFSLADIAMTPYVNRLDMLGMAAMWERTRPRVTDWFNRIKARPAFKPAFLDWCPPDLTADLLTFGRQSWPSVEKMLAQAAEQPALATASCEAHRASDASRSINARCPSFETALRASSG